MDPGKSLTIADIVGGLGKTTEMEMPKDGIEEKSAKITAA